jgi:sugar lactone lactonase YvrE
LPDERVVVQAADVELVATGRGLGEGPAWDERQGVLWWVDIFGGAVHRYDPGTGIDTAIDLGQTVGAVIPRERGGLVVALTNGIAALDPVTNGLEMLVEIEADVPGNRMNDAKCDTAGRLWGGTMSIEEQDPPLENAALYCVDTGRSVRTVLTGISISNGLGWSPDDRAMYYIDTPTYGVDVLDFDAVAGEVSNRCRLISVAESEGMPDGMTVDAEGYLWVAVLGSRTLSRFAPDGTLDRAIELPVPQATSCAFGGADLRDLYITTYRSPDSPPDSPAGGLFRCRPGVTGLPTAMFRG